MKGFEYIKQVARDYIENSNVKDFADEEKIEEGAREIAHRCALSDEDSVSYKKAYLYSLGYLEALYY